MYLRISKHVECCVVHKEPFESAKFEKIIKRFDAYKWLKQWVRVFRIKLVL